MMPDIFTDVSLSYFKSDSRIRKAMTQLRKATQYELEFYKTGSGTSFVDKKIYKHSIGNILLAKPHQLRQSQDYFECFAVHFSCPDRAFAEAYIDRIPNCVYMPSCEPLFEQLILSRMTNEQAQCLHVNACILQIISRIHEFYPLSSASLAPQYVTIENLKRINRITDYIKKHYSEEIKVSELPSAVFMSRSSFFDTFKRVTGYTPSDYINTVRIENAKILLDTSELTAAQIAQECGFCSQAYFNYIFRRKTGLTPISYR